MQNGRCNKAAPVSVYFTYGSRSKSSMPSAYSAGWAAWKASSAAVIDFWASSRRAVVVVPFSVVRGASPAAADA